MHDDQDHREASGKPPDKVHPPPHSPTSEPPSPKHNAPATHHHSHDHPHHDPREHDHGVPHLHTHDHSHDPGELCCRDTFVTINGMTVDLAREPLTVEFCGFRASVSYSAARERTPGERTELKHHNYDITVLGPDQGDPGTGRPPGRLIINGKHIEYEYEPATGQITHHGMFSVHQSVSSFARAYVSADPTLRGLEGHHGHHGHNH